MENEVVYSVEGSPRTYSVTKFPLYDSAGGIYGIGCIAADITERKRSEESLRQSEQNLTEFFDHAPIGLEWLSASGTILRANQVQMDLLGYRPKEYLAGGSRAFQLAPTSSFRRLLFLPR
jgi:PAS domain-containing protein